MLYATRRRHAIRAAKLFLKVRARQAPALFGENRFQVFRDVLACRNRHSLCFVGVYRTMVLISGDSNIKRELFVKSQSRATLQIQPRQGRLLAPCRCEAWRASDPGPLGVALLWRAQAGSARISFFRWLAWMRSASYTYSGVDWVAGLMMSGVWRRFDAQASFQ